MKHFKMMAVGAGALAIAFSTSASAASLLYGFEGTNQLGNCALNQCFRPPDTMGAVGTNHYFESSNGSFQAFNKNTGALLQTWAMPTFWANAGLAAGGLGDNRVLFDSISNRWMVIGFAGTTNVINMAVSATDNALGTWNATSFTVTAAGTTADYPTLAIDRDAVYIGTNNFTPGYSGTSLLILPRASAFAAGGPTAAGLDQINTANGGLDRGFAIQGVNSTDNDGVGRVVADSNVGNYSIGYDVNNPAGAATLTAAVQTNSYAAGPPKGRQPDGTRLVDTLDTRISSNAWEMNGKIYYTQTMAGSGANAGSSVIRVVVIDSVSKAVLSQTEIGDPNYDFYQGSLAINSAGKLVVGYNRSGFSTVDGQISIFARVYDANANGTISQTDEIFIRKSDTNGYRCGEMNVIDTACRQRWGDYAAVSLDPVNSNNFFVIGEYAQASAIIPNFTTTTRSIWGTYIGVIGTGAVAAVPEPATWAQMLLGFGLIGGAIRRKRVTNVTYSVA
jgi:PEP-CTERM motif